MAEKETGVSFENVQEFIKALSTMPTKEILRELVNQTSIKAQERIALQPAPTGATAGTSGLHSTGGVKTAQRTMYVRGVGAFYVRKDGSMTATKKRSEDLQQSWRRASSLAGQGMKIDVRTTVSYAGHVQGGANDDPQQSQVMKTRGWQTTDAVAEWVERDAGKIMNNVFRTKYSEWLTQNGITNTTS